jgi:hypothetical protein
MRSTDIGSVTAYLLGVGVRAGVAVAGARVAVGVTSERSL